MKITVSLFCRHPDGYSNHVTIEGSRTVLATSQHVFLDGVEIVRRDRRAKRNREEGHPWVSSPQNQIWDDRPDHQRQFEAWTGFRVTVDP